MRRQTEIILNVAWEQNGTKLVTGLEVHMAVVLPTLLNHVVSGQYTNKHFHLVTEKLNGTNQEVRQDSKHKRS